VERRKIIRGGRAVALSGALVALAGYAHPAAAVDYRLRWVPTADARVTRYNVYTRQSGAQYGVPRNAGLPAVETDGAMSYVVTGLSGAGLRFAITAVTSAGQESAFSNEIASCTSASECNDGSPFCRYTAAPTGTACSDGDQCDGVETCRNGACQGGVPLDCDDGDECTADGCNATAGCTHTEIPSCSLCTSTSRVPLEARRLKLTTTSYGVLLTAEGIVGPVPDIDFSSTGLVLEVVEGAGSSLVRAIIPGSALVANRKGTAFRLAKDAPLSELGGIRKLKLRRRADGRLAVSTRGRTAQAPASFPTSLTLLFLAGSHCALDSCIAYPRTSDCE
jgi:hypothetical protein